MGRKLTQYWLGEFSDAINTNEPDIIMWVASDCIKSMRQYGFLVGGLTIGGLLLAMFYVEGVVKNGRH